MGARSRLAQVYYDLATLLDAGVPILRTFEILTEGFKGPLKDTLVQVRNSLSQGLSLAEAMDRHSHIFPDLDRMITEAAETAGSLGDSFKMLSQWHEFMHRVIRRIQVGLIYPFFILHFAVFALCLPALALGRIGFGEYFLRVFQILLFFLWIPTILIVVAIRLRERIPVLRRPLDFIALKIPVLGQAIYHVSVCRYAKAFAMLYRAGVPITETTERATRATGNVVVADQLAGSEETVRRGAPAWEGFSGRLPAEYRHLWQIGEESGELDRVAAKVADIAGDRADLFFTAFASGFPKVIYITVVIAVAVVVLYMWKQIYAGITPGF